MASRLTGTWLAGDPGDVSRRIPGASHVRVDRTANAGGSVGSIHHVLPGAKCAYLSVAGSWLDTVPGAPHHHGGDARLRRPRALPYFGLSPLLQPRILESGCTRTGDLQAGADLADCRSTAGGAGRRHPGAQGRVWGIW